MNNLIIQNNQDLESIIKTIPGLSKSTQDTYGYAIKSYERYIKNNNLILGIDSVKEWINSKEEPETRNLYIEAIKRVLKVKFKNHPELLNLMEELKILKKVKVNKTIKDGEYLTYQEIEKLTKNCNEKYSLIIWSLFWTGCRISELLSMKIKNCIRDKKIIKCKIVGKGNKQRTVYMPLNVYKEIRNIFDGKTYLFEYKEKPYSREHISREINKLGKKYLEKNISAHILRHSKAMYLKKVKGLSADQVAKALGHSSVVTTLTYYFHDTPTPKEQGIM